MTFNRPQAEIATLAHNSVPRLLTGRDTLDATRSGCDVAVMTTQPGSKSQQNAQRHGFALLYSRAILLREPPQGH